MLKLLRWLALAGLLAGCAGGPTAEPPTAERLAASPSPSPAPLSATPEPEPAAAGLRVWMPPELAPEAEPGGPELTAQLAEFAATAGQPAQVRVKAAAGPGGLLESLIAAYHAAPDALPDVIALPCGDLETPAALGAVLPLDDRLPAALQADAYPFARTLGQAAGHWYGVPFAVDARVLVFNAATYATPPLRWSEVLTGTLIFPGAEPDGLTLLSDYLAGGPLLDEAGRPRLEATRLAASLAALRDLAQAGRLPLSTLDYADPAATWQVFRERRAGLALTSASWFLREAGRVAGAAAAAPPTTRGVPFTLAEGWCWALVNAGRDPQAAAGLVAWLMTPARHGAWTLAAGVLPAAPAALAEWHAAPAVPLAAEVLTRAEARPGPALLAAAGPLLRRAWEDVLNGRATPEAAAAAAAQSLADQQP
ncbi:MAG: extracellular solute-binding protein [Anaerolineales bacterium]|nr:extracellular solute-binding protein [Anaerolineales bacterium]